MNDLADQLEKSALLIDDDIVSLDILSALLEGFGYSVHRATSGPEALELIEQQEIDLVIVDMMMPKMNGIETVTHIRSLGLDMPIVAFTAVDEETLHQEAVDSGCQKVITKPCRPQKLQAILKELFPDG